MTVGTVQNLATQEPTQAATPEASPLKFIRVKRRETSMGQIAKGFFTPERQSLVERFKTEVDSPTAKTIVWKQHRNRLRLGTLWSLPHSATQTNTIHGSPTSISIRSRQLGRGGQGTVYLSKRVYNDPQREAEYEAYKSYQRSPRIWGMLFEFSPEEKTFINFPNRIYKEENGGFVAFLPKADTDMSKVGLSRREFPIETLLGWIRDVAEGVEVMHSKGILHRDIKPDNILIFPGWQVAQIGDLDLADKAQEEEHVTSCTPYFSPPNIWGDDLMKQRGRKGIQTKADDVFSLGRTIQYGVIKRIFCEHEETKALAEEMTPQKIELPKDEKSAYEQMHKLNEENPGPVMISEIEGRKQIPSLLLIFPTHEKLREITQKGKEKLQEKLSPSEYRALCLAVDWADRMQQDDPTSRPTMAEVKSELGKSLSTPDQSKDVEHQAKRRKIADDQDK